MPLLAAARFPSAETVSTSIAVPWRNRDVPNRSVLPAGSGSSGGSASGWAAATGAGDGVLIGTLPPEAAAHPTRPTARSVQPARAAGRRRGGLAASAATAGGTAFDHGDAASSTVRATSSEGTTTAASGASTSADGARPRAASR